MTTILSARRPLLLAGALILLTVPAQAALTRHPAAAPAVKAAPGIVLAQNGMGGTGIQTQSQPSVDRPAPATQPRPPETPQAPVSTMAPPSPPEPMSQGTKVAPPEVPQTPPQPAPSAR
ncbi:hypothetical protein [Oleisolibacter albus]|uniref:hypothetical protein n=1 Tax=Oleisolibacter albus TaxID=2171757 RepID=UPI000DF2DE0B|nr:hypothetical protein [Oleisolibacter albus]